MVGPAPKDILWTAEILVVRSLLCLCEVCCAKFACWLARGEGRVPIEKIPYLPEDAIPFLQKYEQLILVGALFPVTTFAYKGKPVIKVPASCQVTAMATVDHDIWLALGDLAKAVGAAFQPTVRQARSKGAPPAGVLTDAAVGQSIGLLLPENAILAACRT